MSVCVHTACAKQKEKKTYTSTRTWTSLLWSLKCASVVPGPHGYECIWMWIIYLCFVCNTYWCIFRKFIKLFWDCLIILADIFVCLVNRFLVSVNVRYTKRREHPHMDEFREIRNEFTEDVGLTLTSLTVWVSENCRHLIFVRLHITQWQLYLSLVIFVFLFCCLY